MMLRTPSGVPASDAKTGSELLDQGEASRCSASIRESDGRVCCREGQEQASRDGREGSHAHRACLWVPGPQMLSKRYSKALG